MTDIITPDDLKSVYKRAQESTESGQLRISVLLEPPFSFGKEKARTVMMKLVQNRLAYVPASAMGGSASDFSICVRDQELAVKLKAVTNPETYAVFQIIELSGNMGLGNRDILRGLNDRLKKSGRPPLQPPAITRALKTLEAERLIKPIKSVKDNGRKIYILHHLDGDRAIVGGVFYKDGNFNIDLVEEYRNKVLNYLQAQTHHIPRQQLLQYVYSTGGDASGGVRLGESDLDKIIRTLVLDNYVIQMIHPYTGDVTFASARWPSFEDLERLPCASCPLQQVCQIEEVDHFDSIALRRQNLKTRETARTTNLGVMQPENYLTQLTSKVTPSTCPYMNQWLKLPFMPWVLPEDQSGKEPAALENNG